MKRPVVDPRFAESVLAEAKADYAYFTFMTLSGVLAALAFLTDSIPMLLGAMIVAPAYPPLAAISTSLAAGYVRAAGRGAALLLLGLALAVAGAVATTWFVTLVGFGTGEIFAQPLLEERVRTGWYSVMAAVTAGLAGTIAVVKRKQDTLIGIVASIALVPAAAAGGLALYAGDVGRSIGGFTLLFVNVLTIVALGLLVLVLLRPGRDQAHERERERGAIAGAQED